MKKYLILIFAGLLVFMVACGKASDESNKPVNNNINSSDENEDLAEKNEEKAEVTDIKYYKWFDEAMDNETITVYAEIKNTGNTNIDAGMVNITYLDSTGSVIAVNEGQVSPRFLKEGSTGYVSAEIEGDIDQYEDLDNIEIEVSPAPFQDTEIVEFITKDENLKVGIWREENSKISVVGFFENESDIKFSEDDTSAVVGLYDKDGNFLAAESMYQGQGFSIDAKDRTSFEIAGGNPLPPEVGKEVDRAEVKAIGIENMDDYWW